MVTPERQRRIYWIDALKALVVVGIALFHSALVFTAGTWIVNNAQRSVVLSALAGFTFQWGIALLFLLSGTATWFGLRSRSAVQFATSRIVRLGLPLVAGVVVLSPLQSYVQHTPGIGWSGIPRSYVTFWSSVQLTWHPSSAYDVLYHLWFLAHLMVISIATLPVVLWLRSSGGRRVLSSILALVQRPGGFLAGVVPFALVQLALHPKFPAYQDWADLAAWSVLYIEGFVIMSDARFAAALRRSLWPALVCAASLVGAGGLLGLGGYTAMWDAHPEYSPAYLFLLSVRAVTTWSWLVFFIALGVRWLDRDNRVTEWGADRPLPFYVLSHPVIVVIARYVVGWDEGLWLKFAVIATGSIAITLVLCEMVSANRVLRVLFGLSAVPKPRHASAGVHVLSRALPETSPRSSGSPRGPLL